MLRANLTTALLVTSSLCCGFYAFPSFALAQAQTAPETTPADAETTEAVGGEEEIVVTARRRQESAQDVPLVVNAVTSEDLQKLNIREFRDIQTLVPGLALTPSANGIGANATLRGVNFDVNASGNNGTIEFYLNDSPISSGVLFQSMFDVGQIEVLRGPQGTLRGRASPSGSITITTRRPDLSEVGGYVQMTGTHHGEINANGAVNLPLIQDVLAVRVAGVVDSNSANQVESLNHPANPTRKTRGARITLRFEPIDSLSLLASYTKTVRTETSFDQVESVTVVDPTGPASPIFIEPSDRLAVGAIPRHYRQAFQIYNWQAEWRFAGQRLNYVGNLTKQHTTSFDPNGTTDDGGFFTLGGTVLGIPIAGDFSRNLEVAGQATTPSRANQFTHELRLSSAERLFGMVDYIIGGFWNRLKAPTILDVQTPIFFGFPPTPTTGFFINRTRIDRGGETLEKSVFGNITVHLGEATEVSGGIRRISYHSEGFLLQNGIAVPAANEDRTLHATIYSASVKHRFNDNLMAYATFGTSWRPGSATNPIIDRNNVAPSPREAAFLFPPPEKSKSFEVGIKSDWLDRRVRFNITAYHQKFDNYILSAPGVWVAGTRINGAQEAQQLNPGLAVGVPAKVNGIEAEIGFAATPRWSIDATLSYSKSKVSNGIVPCNDFFNNTTLANVPDGIPDPGNIVPTFQQIKNALGAAETIQICTVNQRAGVNSPFVATLQSEYSLPITPHVDAFVRGLLNFYNDSQNQPTNLVDDINAYALVNLYAGVRDPEGAWEIQAYAKNIFDTERVLTRTAGPLTHGFNVGATGFSGVTTYRGITMTAPREFGVTARFAFGSR